MTFQMNGDGALRLRNILITVGLIFVVCASLFVAATTLSLQPQKADDSTPPVLVGVEIGWRATVADCKALVDKVQNYSNLLIIGTGTITCNEAWLNETCSYAVNAGMYVMVYFGDQFYSNSEVSNMEGNAYNPLIWVMKAKENWGIHFLGAYFYDEPGGEQLDSSGIGTIYIGGTVVPPSYMDLANSFEQANARRMSAISYLSCQVDSLMFTSDYGCYWFDYQSGYDVVLAQLGWNNSRLLQISLTRGAANVQGKDWGVIVTWTYQQPPYMETGSQLYEDMVLSYDSGAKYISVYDASDNWQNTTLIEEHYAALQDFWNYMQQNPDRHGILKPEAAYVLPRDYGFGFRNQNDSVWGIKQPDEWTHKIYTDVHDVLQDYGGKVDIVYNEAAYNSTIQSLYGNVIYWNSGAQASGNYPIINLNTTLGYQTIQAAITSPATCTGDTILVKPGTYRENIDVFRSINLVGDDKAATIIDGANKGNTLTINGLGVNVTGFTLKNGGNQSSQQGAALILRSAINCSIVGNDITASQYGAVLQDSVNATFRNNHMFGNVHNFGVNASTPLGYVNDVDASNTVDGKPICYWVDQHDTVVPSGAGYVALVNCSGITAQNLQLSGNEEGLLLAYTQASTLTNNTLTGNYVGLKLEASEGNTIRDNSMSGNTYNFWVATGLANDIDASNSVDGKPIYYWVNQHDEAVPLDAGYVALINCTGITVQNLQLTNNGQGILLSNTSGSTVAGNNISNQANGITLESAQNNTVTQNTISHNMENGINALHSDDNIFSENLVANNLGGGVALNESSSNNVFRNNVTANGFGVQIRGSLLDNGTDNLITENWITQNTYHFDMENWAFNNTAYHNNVVNNMCQQPANFDDGNYPIPPTHILWNGLTNFWDNGSSGNYWSDYSGVDENHDGVGGTSYYISIGYVSIGQDNYPLMQPYPIP